MATLVKDTHAEQLRQDEKELIALAQTVQRKKEELAEAEKALEVAEVNFEWNRLMANAKSDESAVELADAVDEAIRAFEKSLVPPADYEGDLDEYIATDDCGDLSSVENTIDDVLEEISQYRRADVEKNLERSVAMLLLVSYKFKQVASGMVAADGATKSATTEATATARTQALQCPEYEDMRQSLIDEWADTLTDLAHVGEDSSLVLRILTEKLGAPFDEVALRGAASA